MARRVNLNSGAVSMSFAVADKLLTKGSGDAALLYLYLLRNDGFYDADEVCRRFQWSRARLDSALLLLGEMGVDTGAPVPEYHAPAVPDPASAPDYTREDIAQSLQHNEEFAELYRLVTTAFSVPSLTDRDTKILLEIFDYLDMSTEVFMMLLNFEITEYRRKHHSTVKVPPMTYIRSAAYRWKRSGVDSFESADSYLKRLEYYRSQEGELLAAVGIVGRSALSEEKRYLDQWIDWNFSAESVQMAYERTLFHNGKMAWGYCNGILRRWHQEGLRTPEEIRLHDAPKRPAKGGAASRTGLTPAQPMSAAQQEAEARELEESRRQMMEILGIT